MFGLCHLSGYRFAPRIKDLKDRKLHTVEKPGTHGHAALGPVAGETRRGRGCTRSQNGGALDYGGRT